jgi:fused signal recognition particle receptor
MEFVVIAAVAVVAVLLAAFAWRVRRSGQAAVSSAPPGAIEAPRSGPARWFFDGLARSRAILGEGLARVFAGGRGDTAAWDALEELLIQSDVGVRAASGIVSNLQRQAAGAATADALRECLRVDLLQRLGDTPPLAARPSSGPLVILVVGVNGSGKTTTIGKLAARYRAAGQSVLLGAGDTFRAGAIEQLRIWAERTGAGIVAHQEGADPSAVLFDTVQAGISRGVDVVICDTAGRLQAQKPLMDELGKVVRVMRKALPTAPHEVLLVLDSTIGQNALSQARVFKEVVGVTGVALTKLDGTARGGVVVAVREELGIPVKLVGLGERVDDLRDFDAPAFVDGLLGR